MSELPNPAPRKAYVYLRLPPYRDADLLPKAERRHQYRLMAGCFVPMFICLIIGAKASGIVQLIFAWLGGILLIGWFVAACLWHVTPRHPLE